MLDQVKRHSKVKITNMTCEEKNININMKLVHNFNIIITKIMMLVFILLS